MWKKVLSCLLALLLVSSSLFALSAQSPISLGEQIYGDLLTLEQQIRESNRRLESLEQTLSESEKSIEGLQTLQQKKELLQEQKENELKALQALLDKREWTLKQLGMLVDDQKTLYQKSLRKWRFGTITLGISSAALLGMVIYQGATR